MRSCITLANICGQKWPRLLSPTWAAAYCSMSLGQFREWDKGAALIHIIAGREAVDRQELDSLIELEKQARKEAATRPI